jgi:prepilin-type N-terminal cleavage/methylation domain-containing protein
LLWDRHGPQWAQAAKEPAEEVRVDRRGFTLVEVVAAVLLLTVVGLSVSTALLAGRAAAVHGREQAIGRIAAQSRLATLARLAFYRSIDAAGAAVAVTDTTTDLAADPATSGGAGLQPSPAGSLWRDTAGYVDYLDATGRALGADAEARARAAYVRRWAVGRQGDAAGEVALFAVLVAPMATALHTATSEPARLGEQPGVVLLRGTRHREAR